MLSVQIGAVQLAERGIFMKILSIKLKSVIITALMIIAVVLGIFFTTSLQC